MARKEASVKFGPAKREERQNWSLKMLERDCQVFHKTTKKDDLSILQETEGLQSCKGERQESQSTVFQDGSGLGKLSLGIWFMGTEPLQPRAKEARLLPRWLQTVTLSRWYWS